MSPCREGLVWTVFISLCVGLQAWFTESLKDAMFHLSLHDPGDTVEPHAGCGDSGAQRPVDL